MHLSTHGLHQKERYGTRTQSSATPSSLTTAARVGAVLGFFACFLTSGVAQQKTVFTEQVYQRIDMVYGSDAAEDVADWRQLYSINRFFNRFDFVDDLVHWNEKDYWATPIEFIATGAGDCEDYTIAKYFSLIELGVPESQLRLMYVTALELRQPHMVLAYYKTPTSIPLVLDNINRQILPANKRRDLSPIYSFNGNGLWAAKAMGTGRKLRGSGPMKMWDDMVERLERVMYGDKEK